jgi:hypothetical protein
MKVHIEFDPSVKKDYKALLSLLQNIGEPLTEDDLAVSNTEEPVKGTPCEKQEDEQPVVAEPAPVEEVKAEEPAPVEEVKAEEPAPVETPEGPVNATAPVKTMSQDEWTKILLDKRIELGLLSPDGKSVGEGMASTRAMFNEFVKEQSKKYGSELPKKLSPEALYAFVHEVFKHIAYDPINGFKVGEYQSDLPF